SKPYVTETSVVRGGVLERYASIARANDSGICAAQQVRELPGIGHRLIAEAVVHQDVDVAGGRRQMRVPGDPLCELPLGVEVAEAFGDGLLLPGFGVAAVEADHREGGGGGFGEGGGRGAGGLGHVDADQG